MKNLFLIIGFCIHVFLCQAQSGSHADGSDISLKVFIPDQNDKSIDDYVKVSLGNKLTQMATDNGFSNDAIDARFVLFPQIFVDKFETVPGTVPKVEVKINVSLYIADYSTKTVFATTNIKCIGIGDTERHAYHNAISTINSNESKTHRFLQDGKIKIIDYYKRNCDLILQKVKTLSYQKDYDRAFYELATIPFECTECYKKANEVAKGLYDQYLEYNCNVSYAKARNLWNSNPTYESAVDVESYLSSILPGSKCYNEVMRLVSEIKNKVLSDENRNWNFFLKVFDSNIDIEKQKIKAIRDIGVAYGNNQPDIEYNVKEIYK